MDEWIEKDEQARLPPPKEEVMDDDTLLLPESTEPGSTAGTVSNAQHNGAINASNNTGTINGAEDMDEGE